MESGTKTEDILAESAVESSSSSENESVTTSVVGEPQQSTSVVGEPQQADEGAQDTGVDSDSVQREGEIEEKGEINPPIVVPMLKDQPEIPNLTLRPLQEMWPTVRPASQRAENPQRATSASRSTVTTRDAGFVACQTCGSRKHGDADCGFLIYDKYIQDIKHRIAAKHRRWSPQDVTDYFDKVFGRSNPLEMTRRQLAELIHVHQHPELPLPKIGEPIIVDDYYDVPRMACQTCGSKKHDDNDCGFWIYERYVLDIKHRIATEYFEKVFGGSNPLEMSRRQLAELIHVHQHPELPLPKIGEQIIVEDYYEADENSEPHPVNPQ